MKTLDTALVERQLNDLCLITESSNQDDLVSKFKSLEDVHKKLFPNSWQSVYYTDKYINIPNTMVIFRSTLKNKWDQNFKENDPQDTIFSIQKIGDNYQAILVKGKQMRTKTSYSAKLAFRKATGDIDTVIKKITEWEQKRKKMFDENKDNMNLD